MTEEDLKTLAEAIHAITYTVPGHISSFEMEFEDCHVTADWDMEAQCYRVVI